jgi:ABC-type amino acid transport substrate-binding protein
MNKGNKRGIARGGLVALVCTAVLATAIMPPATSAKASVTLRVGIYENEPLIYTDETGAARGVYADILDHIASEEGWSLEYVRGSWEECLDRLARGEIDVLTDIAYTDERSEVYDFSNETVFVNWGRLYVQPGAGIVSFLDLEDRRIAVVREDIYYNGLASLTTAFDVNCTYVEVAEYADALASVENGSADAGVVNRLFGMRFWREYDIDRSPLVFSPTELRFAFPKKADMNPYLVERIDFHMAAMKGDETSSYYRAMETYLGMTIPAGKRVILMQESEIVLLLLGMVVVLFVAMNRSRLQRIPSSNIIIAAFGVLFAGWVLTNIEGLAWEDALNAVQHACYAGGALLVALWCWEVFGREVNRG